MGMVVGLLLALARTFGWVLGFDGTVTSDGSARRRRLYELASPLAVVGLGVGGVSVGFGGLVGGGPLPGG